MRALLLACFSKRQASERSKQAKLSSLTNPGSPVSVPPSFVETQTSKVVEVGEASDATLQCTASGSPKPVVSWRRDDGLPIKLRGNLQAGKRSEHDAARAGELLVDEVRGEQLLLKNVDRSMSAVYICTASNGIPPSASKQVPLYVKCEYFAFKSAFFEGQRN